jgi:hypothetical protein
MDMCVAERLPPSSVSVVSSPKEVAWASSVSIFPSFIVMSQVDEGGLLGIRTFVIFFNMLSDGFWLVPLAMFWAVCCVRRAATNKLTKQKRRRCKKIDGSTDVQCDTKEVQVMMTFGWN